MTYREKIIFLKRYAILDKEIDRLVDEVEDWRSRLGKITPTLSHQPPGGGSIYPAGDIGIIDKIVDIERLINVKIDELIELRKEIAPILEAVEDDRERLLLNYRYIDGKTFEWIAGEMNYSWKWVHILHKRALKKLEINVCIEVHIENLI